MNIHEYQAKQLYTLNGVPTTPPGFVCQTPLEAEFAFRRLGTPVCVVKAQVHAGGRGKAGGVKLVRSPEEAAEAAKKMLGMRLVTPQTGAEGKLVRTIYVEPGTDIDKEYYLAFLLDRATASIAVMFTTEGGVDIEELAEKHPEKIVTIHIDPSVGIMPYHMRTIAAKMKLPKEIASQLGDFIKKAYPMFAKYDMSMLEVNPLVVNKQGKLLALDGKMNFDDNALFRHRELEAMRDLNEEDPQELQASKYGLNYVHLGGNIGCLVNGAGLAMATMDIIKLHGGNPANFLDVGGGATKEQVRDAFKILLSDSTVKAIFVNIFGGIMRCDTIAEGVIAAAKELAIKVPVVVRLEGTNVEQGRKLLETSGLKLIAATDMTDGAKKAVAAAKG
jgi:succinyl-CoA synthetase beta subunit